MKSILLLLAYLLLVGIVAWFGGQFRPDEWYYALNKAPWNPPDIAFPIAWSIIYPLIAICGWLAYKTGDKRLNTLWFIQIAINGLWQWLFFGIQRPDLSLLNILLLAITIVTFLIISLKQQRKLIAILWLPYVLWISLAISLNVYIVLNN